MSHLNRVAVFNLATTLRLPENFNLAILGKIRQINKLKHSPNFPVIQYLRHYSSSIVLYRRPVLHARQQQTVYPHQPRNRLLSTTQQRGPVRSFSHGHRMGMSQIALGNGRAGRLGMSLVQVGCCHV